MLVLVLESMTTVSDDPFEREHRCAEHEHEHD
jgi:hypothetical protein